jgi:hypothetical protein
MTLLHTTAPYWEVWHAWFLSDKVGIVVVPPLMIGLGQMWREAPTPSHKGVDRECRGAQPCRFGELLRREPQNRISHLVRVASCYYRCCG